ncbi:DUF3828 domain-containing protein [Brevundimonas sp.]|uniref:DUF3828 domain-containing protein n=1 Tax=Brevundimonas sp. TaxID=1871086 RepID=UPI002D71840C|nr:DUF3828 domain-containing protein [Brevundimonas sp.]HYC69211.1 DUF3828 domain-containing protein [Brevundimonas sp.]
MRSTLIPSAVALALAACSAPAARTEAPEVAAAPAAVTPEAFVRSLYEDGGPGTGAESYEALPVWSARTRRLMAEAARLTPADEIGFFDAQPFCDCQDGTPVLQSVTAVAAGEGRADVAVVQGFAEPGNDVHRKTYNLVLEGGQWRIDDQHYESMGEFPYEPMVERLNGWIAEARARG